MSTTFSDLVITPKQSQETKLCNCFVCDDVLLAYSHSQEYKALPGLQKARHRKFFGHNGVVYARHHERPLCHACAKGLSKAAKQLCFYLEPSYLKHITLPD